MSQRGQTLVELLVGMALAGVILGSLAGLLYTVGSHSQEWETRVAEASVGDALVAAIQADAQRYPCVTTAGQGARLTFHGPPAGGPLSFTYFSTQSPATGTWLVARGMGGSPGTGTVIDRLPGQPQFSVSAPTITVQLSPGLRSRGSLVVYYAAPPGACS